MKTCVEGLCSYRQGTIFVLRPADAVPHPRRRLNSKLLAGQRCESAAALKWDDDLAALFRTCGLQFGLPMPQSMLHFTASQSILKWFVRRNSQEGDSAVQARVLVVLGQAMHSAADAATCIL